MLNVVGLASFAGLAVLIYFICLACRQDQEDAIANTVGILMLGVPCAMGVLWLILAASVH